MKLLVYFMSLGHPKSLPKNTRAPSLCQKPKPKPQVYNKVNLFTSPQAAPLSLPSGNDFDLPVVSSLSKTSSEPPEVEEDEDEAGDCDFSSAPSFA